MSVERWTMERLKELFGENVHDSIDQMMSRDGVEALAVYSSETEDMVFPVGPGASRLNADEAARMIPKPTMDLVAFVPKEETSAQSN